jgi:hypothetical protein
MDAATSELIKWAVQQGALTVLVLVGGFFWWRDSKRREEMKDATVATLIGLVNQVNTQQATQTAAIRDQAVATAQLSSTLGELKDEIRALVRTQPPISRTPG